MIYVRDRHSSLGMTINQNYIKNSKTITPATLLQHGDQVHLPNATFELVQPSTPGLRLTPFQSEEVRVSELPKTARWLQPLTQNSCFVVDTLF